MQENEKTALNAKQLLDWLMIGSEEDLYQDHLSDECESGGVPRIPNYEIEEKIGDAGQGQVWRALHMGIRRHVALKVPKYHGMADKKAYLRFVREVEFISKLEHPNIVKILDSGVHYGSYYFSMELIDGKHLDDYVYDNKLSVPEIMRLFTKICDAMEYAHANNVIHRDLKPSNILISGDGEPHILDFGLAKFDQNDEVEQEESALCSRAGTPAFMSPEQAGGRQAEVSVASDIFSLGVVLFNLLTGDFPIDLGGPKELVLERISQNKLKSWVGIKGLDHELTKIFKHIFQLNPADRYSSVADLCRDINNYLTSRPLVAGSGSVGYRLGKLLKRNQVAVWVVVVALMISLLLAGYMSYNSRHNFREEFNYAQGIEVAQIPGWETLLSSKPATPMIVFNGQVKELFVKSQDNVIITSQTLNALSESRFSLRSGMSFRGSIDISFDGEWSEAAGLVFCLADKDNFYSAELITKTPEKNLLVLKRMQGGQSSQIAYKNMFDLNFTHTYRLSVAFDSEKKEISAELTDLADNKQFASLFSAQAELFDRGRFGMITNCASHTFIDNFDVRLMSRLN